jgi:hypothetical protein
MALKSVSAAVIGAVLLACSSAAIADEYRADEFLGLDLSKAALSPKRLGPEARFAPVAVEAKTDRKGDAAQAWAEPKAVRTIAVHKARVAHVAQMRAEKPRGAARVKLARRHGNPLDAQAFDTRIQAWPCKSGGICNWKQ